LACRRCITIVRIYDFLCRLCSESDPEAIFLFLVNTEHVVFVKPIRENPQHEVAFEKTDKFV